MFLEIFGQYVRTALRNQLMYSLRLLQCDRERICVQGSARYERFFIHICYSISIDLSSPDDDSMTSIYARLDLH